MDLRDNIFDLPPGESCSDQRWQDGYNRAPDAPENRDPVYLSGWCHGYSEVYQTGPGEAEGVVRTYAGHGVI